MTTTAEHRWTGRRGHAVETVVVGLRGGSWDLVPRSVRSANRDGLTAVYRLTYAGFRVSRTLD